MDDETAMPPAGISRWEIGSTGEFIEGPEFWALVDRHRISGNRLGYHSGAFRGGDGTWYWPETMSPSERARAIELRTHALWWAEHERDTSVIPALSDGDLKHYRLLASIRADDTTGAAADQELRRRGIRSYQIAGTLPESVRLAAQPAIPDAAEAVSKHAMAVEYEQAGYRAVAGGRSAEYVNGHLIRWLTEHAGCTVIRVFDAVAEARQKFPPGTRVTHGTVTGGYAPREDGGCSVAVEWDHHGTTSAVPVTLLRAQVRAGDAVWHPDGPSIGMVREAGSDTVRVAFRGLPERRVPAAELAAILPGDPVRVTILHSRPSMFQTSAGVTVREGTYVGPVPMEPSLSHVRIGGVLRRLPTEYVSVPGPAGQAAALAWSRRLSAARAGGPGKEAGSQDRPGTWAAHVKAEDAQDNGNHAAGAAGRSDAFPRQVRPVAPETDGTEARKPGSLRFGRQVTQRGRGRAQ